MYASLTAVLFSVPPSDGFVTLPHTNHKHITRNIRPLRANLLAFTLQDEATSITNNTTSYSNKFDPSDAVIRFLEETDPAEMDRFVDFEELAVVESETSEPTITKPAANNIVRDLDGHALTKEYFANSMGIDNVESYTCRDPFRDFMSNACRVHLVPGGETAFYKLIDFETLDHAQEKLKTAPFKLQRDARSYQVVASFLSSKACRSITKDTGVCIPTLYDVRSEPNYEDPIKSKFSFLFQDLAPADGWYQEWLLQDMESCQAALSTFAKIHAYFWNGSDFYKSKDAARELEDVVWNSGSYVQPTAQGADQWKRVESEWATKRMKFQQELSSNEYWDDLGTRLQSCAEDCGILAHPFACEEDSALYQEYREYRTFTHGDPKQANLLFRRESNAPSKLQVGLIDFQWSGFGLAATDIAHVMTSAVHADMLVDGGEELLMKYYFGELQKYLVEFGAYRDSEEAASRFSYSTFVNQYEIATLDLCRMVIAYTWDRFTEPVEKDDREGCARTMNKTSYNKSIPNAVWLMNKCDEVLKSRGI